MKVLITGATGYIGRRVVTKLVTDFPEVSILTLNRSVAKADDLLPFAQCSNRSVDEMDVAVAEFCPEVCLHLATLSSSRDDADIIQPMLEANVLFGVRLLNALKCAGSLKLFVNTGSFAEFRDGVDAGFADAYLYTATKSAFRHFVDYYAAVCGFKYITAVPFTVYGGSDTGKKLMDYMIDSIDSVEPVKMSPGEQILDFIHVDDVVEFFVKAAQLIVDSDKYNYDKWEKLEILPQGASFYLGTGVGTRVRNLARLIEFVTEKDLNIEWGGRDYRPLDVMKAIAPVELNPDVIDWEAQISLEEGIKQRIIETRK